MPEAIARPETAEHAPFALTYVNAAAAALSEAGVADIRELLAVQCDALEALVKNITEEKANNGYAPGKWSLKESVIHMGDTERIFAYRAMRIARGDSTPLPGFEQDPYVAESRANRRSMQDVLAEFRAVRLATMALVNSFDDAALARTGTASEKPVTVRALCWLVAGHAAHHVALTRDRYVPALS